MKRFAIGVLKVLGVILGLYLIARAVAEPFVIDVTDPATYRDDWGGPALAGVLAVHMGPGVLAALALFGAARRRLAGRRETVDQARIEAPSSSR
ncbi:hypothetical protein AB0F81_14660 [Actinoplanes sp. NPDC024001]|uniref:hypothetical protein n=1 Tax=Actinoplanes sp. NPDC024001 TaxID=3154598 RepID=UPI0033F40645